MRLQVYWLAAVAALTMGGAGFCVGQAPASAPQQKPPAQSTPTTEEGPTTSDTGIVLPKKKEETAPPSRACRGEDQESQR